MPHSAHPDSIEPQCPAARRLLQVLALLSAALLVTGCQRGGSDTSNNPAPRVPSTDPLAVDTPPPDYPLALACAGQGGEVVLVLSLDAQGSPADVRIESSSRRKSLDASAVAAVRGWRFKPATNLGKPVASRLRVPVKFTPPVMRPDRCFAFDEEQRRSQ